MRLPLARMALRHVTSISRLLPTLPQLVAHRAFGDGFGTLFQCSCGGVVCVLRPLGCRKRRAPAGVRVQRGYCASCGRRTWHAVLEALPVIFRVGHSVCTMYGRRRRRGAHNQHRPRLQGAWRACLACIMFGIVCGMFKISLFVLPPTFVW